jgi:uncharacterized protein YciI
MGVLTSWALAAVWAGSAAATEEPKAKTAEVAPQMEQVYLVLLRKGPIWTAEKTAESAAIQKAHMDNIGVQWKAKKLVIAGPMGEDGDLRGIFVYRVGSLDEAKLLAAADPAVKAGRLKAEVHPWWVGKGYLPAAGEACTVPVTP